MSTIHLPMNSAHQHAANAEDFVRDGLLIPASEEHHKATEAYAAAIERTEDPSTKRTLQMLYHEHRKAAKDLERKIEKLKNEGKDPSLPQKSYPTHPIPQPIAGPSRIIPSPPPQHLADSQGTVDESFMLLAGQRSDPGDAFNQFWNIMQGMLDNLSQPVAFATVPLGVDSSIGTSSPKRNPRKDMSHSSDTDPEEPIVSRLTRKFGMRSAKQGRSPPLSSDSSKDFEHDLDDDDFFDEGDDLSGSFYVIPSESSMTALKKENTTLKSVIDSIKKRLETTERVLQMRKEQDMQLRDSIVQASKEAQRAMGASIVGQRGQMASDFTQLNLNVPASAFPIPGIHTAREGQYMRRVKELEEELRAVRVENEKNKAMISKFRERWEKLKESAKRKKESRAAEAAQAVRERIVEEPEPEAEEEEEEEEELDSEISRDLRLRRSELKPEYLSGEETKVYNAQRSNEFLKLILHLFKLPSLNCSAVVRCDWDIKCNDEVDVLTHNPIKSHKYPNLIHDGSVKFSNFLHPGKDDRRWCEIPSIVDNNVNGEDLTRYRVIVVG
ncbi:hypothetical protein D9757_002067 [Collybiopsis confluens]|uniref:Uncharacterized protein n=1 Tax=Collybiopsis confluens TaxID=2823264 RepID=A0A8H5HXL4_9AGAR|nr:hypothetical protein D9757_002067 [Collybiopsis confluens]